MVKNPPAMQKTQGPSLEKGMATHSSILAWRIPQRSLVGYNPWGRKESGMTEQLSTAHSTYTYIQTHMPHTWDTVNQLHFN